jgi:hypothetical protein
VTFEGEEASCSNSAKQLSQDDWRHISVLQSMSPGRLIVKHTIALLLAIAVLMPAHAQQNAPNSSATAQALMSLENKWVDALTKSDVATLDSIFADTYVDTDEHNQRTDKQGVLSALRSGDLKIQSIKLSNMRVYDYGDAAVVTGNSVQVGTFKRQPLGRAILFTDTFVRRNGQWQAVASHRSLANGSANYLPLS